VFLLPQDVEDELYRSLERPRQGTLSSSGKSTEAPYQGVEFGKSERTIADRLRDVSYAELEDFAADVQRRQILDGFDADPAAVTERLLKAWASRTVPTLDD
jgi:hypothetical protein